MGCGQVRKRQEWRRLPCSNMGVRWFLTPLPLGSHASFLRQFPRLLATIVVSDILIDYDVRKIEDVLERHDMQSEEEAHNVSEAARAIAEPLPQHAAAEPAGPDQHPCPTTAADHEGARTAAQTAAAGAAPATGKAAGEPLGSVLSAFSLPNKKGRSSGLRPQECASVLASRATQ